MHRLRLALVTLVLFAAACGGSDTEELLTDLGLSDQEAACLTREYEARGLDVDKLLRADDRTDLSEEETTGLAEVAIACSNIGDGGTDPDNEDGDDGSTDTTADDDSDTDDPPPGDDTDDADDRVDVSDLSPLELAFVEMLEAEGLDATAGICFLTELEAEGFSIFDLAALGIDDAAEPPSGMIAAFLRCGDELADAGITDIEGFFSDGSFADSDDTVANTYGDDPDFDAMWDSCAAGEMTACDELYWLSPIDSEYETFGTTCGLTSEPTGGGCANAGASDGGSYGDDPALDALYDGCAAGDMADCDDLFWNSPIGSEYETFGASCGGTTGPNAGACTTGEPASGNAYGDNPVLDALHDSCAAGDMAACDDLFWDSPIDSEYEAFAMTCGGQDPEGASGGGCSDDGGEPNTYGDDPDLDADWDACVEGSMAACDSLYLWSPFGSGYEAFGNTCGERSEEDWFGGCEAEFG